MTPLELAKEKLTIPDLWQRRGWRGNPGRSCRVPWREDRAPSGSVLPDGKLFHDFTSGETFDAPGLLARVEDLALDAACRLFIQLAGAGRYDMPNARPLPPAMRERRQIDDRKFELPRLDVPTPTELRVLGALRAVSVEACAEAARRGHLFMVDWHRARCWLITDTARRNAQVRRLDGKPFETRDGGSVKALTLPGSCASWPIGTPEMANAKRVILCEGGGDFLAAYHFAEAEGTLADVQPVAMLGAAQRIYSTAFLSFTGKSVRIFPHLDGAGAGAAIRWETQLREAGIEVHCFDLSGLIRDDGAPVKDLNDLTRGTPSDFEANRELWALTNF